MPKFCSGVVLLACMALTLRAQGARPLVVSAKGWSVAVDPGQESVTVSYAGLHTVLDHGQLSLRARGQQVRFKGWSASRSGENTLHLTTAQPQSEWSFDLNVDVLRISCTSADAILVAKAPAPKERIVARTLDPGGVPVNWTGTEEVANGYDGAETRNASFLPQRNPEVMYFSLGQIDGSGFHSLFDRRTDIAIDLGSAAYMHRNEKNEDLLDVTIPVPGNTLIRATPDYYTKTLGIPYYVPFDDSVFPKAPMVWSSWTSYYAEVTEKDIVENSGWIASHLKQYGFQYVQLDDGYDRGKDGEHYWIENWDSSKFPHGPRWLTEQIKAKGLRAGIWLVPNAYAGAVEKHLDWYVRNKQGKLILDYKTPTLDSTNPEVMGFLKTLFQTLDGWGFEYYKFDGEHAFSKYVPSVDHAKLHDPSADPLIIYRDRLKLIRDMVGPQVFLEGCPAGTPLNGIGYFNSYFNGDDVYNSWQGMYPLFSSINANAFLNHVVVYVMPGEGMDVGPRMTLAEAKRSRNGTFIDVASSREQPLAGFGTTLPEARTLASFVSLTGVVYPLSSVLPELPEERIKILEMTLPTMPILPVDLFSRGTDMRWDKFKHERPDTYIHNYPEVLDLKVAAKSGAYDVVALTNWRSGTLHKQLPFAGKLGLSPELTYTVFDYWQQKLLGDFKNQIDLDIDSHDTRVLLIRPGVNRPQLVGDSRHITGAYSVEDVQWNDSKSVLEGSSQTVVGSRYTLTFEVPPGLAVSRLSAASGGRPVAVEHQEQGQALTVSFQGQAASTRWIIEFARPKRTRTAS